MWNENDGKHEEVLGHLLGVAAKSMRHCLDRGLADAGHDITVMHLVILEHVDEREGVNQQSLTDHLFFDKTTVTRVLDSLEERNYVVRIPDKRDRRQNMIYLTKDAKRLIEPVRNIAMETERDAVEGIEPEKVRICKEVLKRIASNLVQRPPLRP